MLYKNWPFDIYMAKYSWAKINKEMDKLISSSQLKKQAMNLFLKSFKIFSYVEINREY